MTVLVLNCGSSSLKVQLVDPETGRSLASGVVERIGEPKADAADALRRALVGFDLDQAGIVAVGHRVVQGGREYSGPVCIDDDVLGVIERLSPLAPLHNPASLSGIRAARVLLPDVPHVAVFDTAFFHDLPDAAATYALDRTVAKAHGIRRYGAHGTSHRYVSARAAEVVGRDPSTLRQIVLHLGNGASASAVVGGRAVDTSMGLTPLEGLVMGTRTGDIDPAVVFHLARTAGMDIDTIDTLLNERSGMKGLCGDNDLRDVHRLVASGDADAALALDVYVHRLKKYIGAYAAILGGLDVLTFTAGVGENDPIVRARAIDGLGFLGLLVDPERNARRSDEARVISPDGAPVTVLVVPTNEELEIARQVRALVAQDQGCNGNRTTRNGRSGTPPVSSAS